MEESLTHGLRSSVARECRDLPLKDLAPDHSLDFVKSARGGGRRCKGEVGTGIKITESLTHSHDEVA